MGVFKFLKPFIFFLFSFIISWNEESTSQIYAKYQKTFNVFVFWVFLYITFNLRNENIYGFCPTSFFKVYSSTKILHFEKDFMYFFFSLWYFGDLRNFWGIFGFFRSVDKYPVKTDKWNLEYFLVFEKLSPFRRTLKILFILLNFFQFSDIFSHFRRIFPRFSPLVRTFAPKFRI